MCKCVLQVRPSDLEKFNLPAQCRLDMTEHDKKMGEELLKEPFIQKHPEWMKELQTMLRTGEKAEIQVLLTLIWSHTIIINAVYDASLLMIIVYSSSLSAYV